VSKRFWKCVDQKTEVSSVYERIVTVGMDLGQEEVTGSSSVMS
jgi:hypothetical protein